MTGGHGHLADGGRAARAVVDAVALALAGSAGAWLPAVLHQPLSWMSVLNSLMRIALPARPVPEVIGIDEFATRYLLPGSATGPSGL